MSPNYIREAWYPVALTTELAEGRMISREVMDEPIVLFGDGDEVRALDDVCPHRFAPLSLGTLEGGIVTCPYHGLRFDGGGRCVHNPHGRGIIPSSAPVRSYAVRVDHGIVWLWAGRGQPEDSPPPLSFLEGMPESAIARGYFCSAGHYQLVIDNLMDLSHADFLHPTLLGTGGAVSKQTPKVRKDGEKIVCSWAWEDEQSMGLFAPFLPQGGAHSDGWLQVEWTAPARMVISAGASSRLNPDGEELRTTAIHALTPANAESTHYVFVALRNWAIDDQALTDLTTKAVMGAFTGEDGPMIAAVQKNMRGRDFWASRPWILEGDSGAIMVRRTVDRLAKNEARGRERQRDEGALAP